MFKRFFFCSVLALSTTPATAETTQNTTTPIKAVFDIVQPIKDEPTPGPVTGLPLPRFASLAKNKAHLRQGPDTKYPINWDFVRKGMPVQITAEYKNWRRVRDFEGVEGWMHRSMLSGRRSVMIVKDGFTMRQDNNNNASAIAKVEPTVTATLETCEQNWCKVNASGHSGWVQTSYLWGVLPSETY